MYVVGILVLSIIFGTLGFLFHVPFLLGLNIGANLSAIIILIIEKYSE